MTLSPFYIYLYGVADNVHSTCQGFMIPCGVIGGLAGLFSFLMLSEGGADETISLLRKLSLRLVVALCILGGINMLVPTSRTVAIMIIAPAIVNSQPIQKDLPELYDIALKALKESLSEKTK